jgi:hypothetical protein
MGQSMKCLNGYLSLCGFKVMNQSCGYSLSVCLYVCLFGLSTSVCVLKWLGLPYEYTYSLLLCPNWVPGLVILSAILCVCLSIHVSTKLQEAKLLHFWFQVCKLSDILQSSCYIFDYEYVCLDG